MNTNGTHKFVIPELTRTPEQRKKYEEMNRLGICPFCSREVFERFNKETVSYENASWFLSTNNPPYKGTRVHLLLIFKGRHIRNITELEKEEWILFHEALKYANNEFKIDSGAIMVRFGEPGHNGSSVEHLHAHIISGAGKMSEDSERIRVKVGYH